MRPSNRATDELRPVTLERGVARYAEGSCLVSFGNTRVLCTASLEEKGPPWRSTRGKSRQLPQEAMSSTDVLRMIKRRACPDPVTP